MIILPWRQRRPLRLPLLLPRQNTKARVLQLLPPAQNEVNKSQGWGRGWLLRQMTKSYHRKKKRSDEEVQILRRVLLMRLKGLEHQ
jgi:hypothetical protein